MPTPRTQTARASLSALLVCDDDDTLIRLRDYLSKAGVQVHATRQLADAWRNPSAAVVLLPDDFDTEDVTDCIRRLLSAKSSPFVLVITAVTRLFQPLADDASQPGRVVIMPKPVWGWTILDLLRSRGQA